MKTVDNEIPDFDGLSGFDTQQDILYLLYIGKSKGFENLKSNLPSGMGYELVQSDSPQQTTRYLLEYEIMCVFIDLDNTKSKHIISMSKNIKQNNPVTRIVLAGEKPSSNDFAELFNDGKINGFLELPTKSELLIKSLSEQEARYSIEKMVTSFVNEPPKLSKASFLLLDPSLAYDDDRPLNFVGIMIVTRTVPIFTRWFEETLKQDEYLLAGYLSSIAALGEDLFHKQESIKEINFGGISVIFRFDGDIQFSFLVRNLTRDNYERAEDRISNLVQMILSEYRHGLENGHLDDKQEQSLAQLLDLFDSEDELEQMEMEETEELIISKEPSMILFYSNNENYLKAYEKGIRKYSLPRKLRKYRELRYEVRIAADEQRAVNLISNYNVDILILDGKTSDGRESDDFADFSKEMKPPMSIIFLETEKKISPNLINAVNHGFIDYISTTKMKIKDMMEYVLNGISKAIKMKEQSSSKDLEGVDSLTVAKMKLRDDLSSYDQAKQPILHGILITQKQQELYDKFFDEVDFDKSMVSGLVESLKNVGYEAFSSEEHIDGLEVAGSTVYVRDRGEHLFIYFVKNVTTTTSVIIGNEIENLTENLNQTIKSSSYSLESKEFKETLDQITVSAQALFRQLLSNVSTEEQEDDNITDEFSLDDIAAQFSDIPSQKEEATAQTEIKTPDIPNIPSTTVPGVPSASVPATPKTDTSPLSDVPSVPGVPSVPKTGIPATPKEDTSTIPDVPSVPSVPRVKKENEEENDE